jgi:filamentous hemagglutinin family protein
LFDSKLLKNIAINGITVGTLFALPHPVFAQVTSDGSLPSPTQVSNCSTTCLISGGTIAGDNLFHSLKNFSISTGGSVFFQSTANTKRIFSRVTGGQASQIDGTIGVAGNADLFLLNPAGIQFGSNAQLNLGGSFIGTTASTIDFDNEQKFGIGHDLLTINTPIGLDILRSSGGISIQDNALPLDLLGDPRFAPVIEAGKPDGLTVAPGKTLALIGNGMTLNQAALVAPSGHLGIHSATGTVAIQETTTGYNFQPPAQSRSNMTIGNLSRLDTSGPIGGSISLSGDAVNISGGSMLLIQNPGNQPLAQGQINVNANSLDIIGTLGNHASRIVTEHFGLNGADIQINANQLRLVDGGEISTHSYGTGDSGNIRINSRSIDLNNNGLQSNAPDILHSIIFAAGIPAGSLAGNGDVSIQTDNLSIRSGSAIAGKNIGVISRDITIDGSLPNGQVSTIFSNTDANQKTGSINISTNTLKISNGGILGSNTSSLGNASSIYIQANTSVEIAGLNPNGQSQSLTERLSSIASVAGNAQLNKLFFGDAPREYGRSGNITINTGELKINQGAIVTRNETQGDAGEISINGQRAIIQQGLFASDAKQGNGGGISGQLEAFQAFDSQFLVSSNGTGIGGNINLNAATVVSFNNLLSASSIGNQGGQVHINSSGVFADRRTQVSVTSARGPEFNGQIVINAGNNKNLRSELKPNVIPAIPPIHNRCADVQDAESSFTQISHGGSPAAPDLIDSRGWVPVTALPTITITDSVKPKYQEAQGWRSIPIPQGKTGRWVSFTTTSTNAHTFRNNPHHANCK